MNSQQDSGAQAAPSSPVQLKGLSTEAAAAAEQQPAQPLGQNVGEAEHVAQIADLQASHAFALPLQLCCCS